MLPEAEDVIQNEEVECGEEQEEDFVDTSNENEDEGDSYPPGGLRCLELG